MKTEYTYQDLLQETQQKKVKAQKELKAALKGPAGFLCKAEIERKPGTVAWLWLAKDFCEKLAEHVDDWMTDDPWDMESREIENIYMAYEDGDSDLYEYLPTEARLFDDWN